MNKIDLLEKKIAAGRDPKAHIPGHYNSRDADSYLTCKFTMVGLNAIIVTLRRLHRARQAVPSRLKACRTTITT